MATDDGRSDENIKIPISRASHLTARRLHEASIMGRLLLTHGQVSVFVSSSVVVVFTFLLFLSGYIIQQQSITGLQKALQPRIPAAPASSSILASDGSATPDLQSSRLFAGRGSQTLNSDGTYPTAERRIDWRRLAHVQLARNHHDVCNAIMVLAEFHKRRSPARRLLLFPRDWALEREGNRKGEFFEDPFMASSRRLLRMAARRYGVELRPVAPVLRRHGEESADVYSLVSAVSLTEFDRVLNIQTPGMVLDATPLDAVLAFTEPVLSAMLEDTTDSNGVSALDLLLLRPSEQTYEDLLCRVARNPLFNDTLLTSTLGEPLLLASNSLDGALVRSVGTLHDVAHGFNQTAYLSDVAYIRFSDPKLPGPEYDVPWSQKVAARPKNKDADWAWTKLYGKFAQKRVEVCGLDLETWRGRG